MKKLSSYIPIFLSAFLLQVQLGYMNGLNFEVSISSALASDPIEANRNCDTSNSAEENSGCIIATNSIHDDGTILVANYITYLIIWAVAFVEIILVKDCLTENEFSCGMGTAAAGLAALAMIAGEIISIVDFKENTNQVQYRADSLQRYGRGCANGETPEGGDLTINGETHTVCDQLNALRVQKENLEAMKSAAETKMGFQYGAATGFGLAALMEGMAWLEGNEDRATVTATITGCITAVETIIQSRRNQSPPQETAMCELCKSALQNVTEEVASDTVEWNNVAPGEDAAISCNQTRNSWMNEIYQDVISNCNGGGCQQVPSSCNFISATQDVITEVNCQGEGGTTACVLGGCGGSGDTETPDADASVDFEKLFEKITPLSFLFSEAYASGSGSGSGEGTSGSERQGQEFGDFDAHRVASQVLGLTGVALVTLLALNDGVMRDVKQLFDTPIKRFGWHTAETALAIGAAVMTQEMVINKLQENIDKLDRILDTVDGEAPRVDDGSTGVRTGAWEDAAGWAENFPEKAIIAEGDPPLPCPGGGDGKGGCRPLKEPLSASLSSTGLGNFGNVGSNLNKLNENMAGQRTVNRAALEATGGLARAHNQVNNRLKKMMKKMNQIRREDGHAPVDFKGQYNKIMNGMQNKAKRLLASKGLKADDLGKDIKGPKEVPKEMEKKLLEQTKKNVAEKGGGGDPFAFIFDEKKKAGMDWGDDPGEPEFNKKHAVRDNDVNKDKGVSIWRQLSTRYMKSAFPVFFDEE